MAYGNYSFGSESFGSTDTTADTIGAEGEITVLIDEEEITTFTDIEIEKRLNEVDTFSFQAFITDSRDRSLINEGNNVKIIEDNQNLLFKGRLTEVKYKSSFRAECEGDGMSVKLLNRKTGRETFTNTPADDIVNQIVNYGESVEKGTIEAAPKVSLRFDHDNKARAVAGAANSVGYDWYIDQKLSEDFDNDYLNFVADAGRDTVQKTFAIGENARMVDRDKDEGFVANDITFLGRGDGINQLEANVFAATTHYTDTTQVINKNDTGSFTVNDATQLGSTGDSLTVRVGKEPMDVTISDSTTLSIDSRAVNDYKGDSTEAIKHYEDIRVFLVENKTTGEGPYTPENKSTAEPGSSIDTFGVKEQRVTDKTIVDISTLEKTADLELKNRFQDVFRLQIDASEPRVTEELRLGDTVAVKDLTAMDVDDNFDIVGFDIKRASSEEGTTLHLANRPRRLTERLSDIESDKNTLNAHMQGATNLDSQNFGDNADNTYPLTSKVLVPPEAVALNKFKLRFTREAFRGYILPTATTKTGLDVSKTSSSDETGEKLSTITNSVPPGKSQSNTSVQANIPEAPTGTFSGATITVSVFNASADTKDWDNIDVENTTANEAYTSSLTADGQIDESSIDTGEGFTGTIEVDDSQASPGDQIEVRLENDDVLDTDSAANAHSQLNLYINSKSSHEHSVPKNGDFGHSHEIAAGDDSYGLFQPSSEPDVDVELYVDGNLVTTVKNVSVGDEVSEIDLSSDLNTPLAGEYHTVKLKPVDTGGGNNGRCRLNATVYQQIFVESTR